MLTDDLVKIGGWALLVVSWIFTPKIMLSDGVKTGRKTAFVILTTVLFALAVGYFSWRIYHLGNPVVGIVGWCICAVLAVGAIIGGIYGHKKGWKQS